MLPLLLFFLFGSVLFTRKIYSQMAGQRDRHDRNDRQAMETQERGTILADNTTIVHSGQSRGVESLAERTNILDKW